MCMHRKYMIDLIKFQPPMKTKKFLEEAGGNKKKKYRNCSPILVSEGRRVTVTQLSCVF